MGFNTTVVVMNDALHEIRDDHTFSRSLYDAVLKNGCFNERVDVGAGCHGNAATVIETHHADGMHAVMVGGNYGLDLGYVGGYSLDVDSDDGRRVLLRQLAANFGFDIKLTKRKTRPALKAVSK